MWKQRNYANHERKRDEIKRDRGEWRRDRGREGQTNLMDNKTTKTCAQIKPAFTKTKHNTTHTIHTHTHTHTTYNTHNTHTHTHTTYNTHNTHIHGHTIHRCRFRQGDLASIDRSHHPESKTSLCAGRPPWSQSAPCWMTEGYCAEQLRPAHMNWSEIAQTSPHSWCSSPPRRCWG